MGAEEKGFEPLIPFDGYTAFRMRRNQPGYATPPEFYINFLTSFYFGNFGFG